MLLFFVTRRSELFGGRARYVSKTVRRRHRAWAKNMGARTEQNSVRRPFLRPIPPEKTTPIFTIGHSRAASKLLSNSIAFRYRPLDHVFSGWI